MAVFRSGLVLIVLVAQCSSQNDEPSGHNFSTTSMHLDANNDLLLSLFVHLMSFTFTLALDCHLSSSAPFYKLLCEFLSTHPTLNFSLIFVRIVCS